MVGPETHMINLDVGEMSYTFRLSLVLDKYCGVDLGSYLGQNKDCQGTPLWVCWVRFMTNLMLSPYAAIQGL